MTRTTRIAALNIAVAILVLALKALAAWQSGSVAILSDAIESIVNVVTAAAAFGAVAYAARPADANHPYGHQKAEYFVALLEALLIGAAAWAIIERSVDSLRVGTALAIPPSAYLTVIAASIVNGAWCAILLRAGRQQRSAALEADGRHLLADVISSLGVLVGVALAQITGLAWLDPALALLVACNILWSGWTLLAFSVRGLMDMAPDEATRLAIARAIEQAGAGAMEAHDIRSRVSGPDTFLEFHLVVDGAMSVAESHAICDRIERTLEGAVPGLRVSIHVEPDEKAKRVGALPLGESDDDISKV